MNGKSTEQVKQELASILDREVNLTMYFGLGDADSRTYERANLVDLTPEAIAQSYAAGLRRLFDNDELTIRALSRFDQRASCLWLYDFKERPAEFVQLDAIQAGQLTKVFSFKEHSVSDIKTIAVRIASVDNAVLLVRKFYPVSLIKRDQILLVKKSDDRLTMFNEDIIKVGFGFEILLLDGDFYINEFARFEKAYAFDAIAERRSKDMTKLVLGLEIVDDVKGYLKSGRMSRKDALRTNGSIVLQLKPAAIVKFAKKKQAGTGLTVVNGKLQLTSLASISRLFKLLNDDYLTSGLTTRDYETLAKNEISAKPARSDPSARVPTTKTKGRRPK